MMAFVFVTMKMALRKKPLSVKQFFALYFAVLLGLALLYLGVTGRLHPLFAVLGVFIPLLFRIVPWLMQGFQAFHLFKQARQFFGYPNTGGGSSHNQSDIKTKFLHMTLNHETGVMDGKVLLGGLKDQSLSTLNLNDLLALLDECQDDADSVNLLHAYLDREHEGWQQNSEKESPPAYESGELNKSQALDILGLTDDATRDDIVAAHRRLMQKMHPDRGGSTYLATRINQAKDFLMERLDD